MKVAFEVPDNYLEELIGIFGEAERAHLGYFRGNVAANMKEAFQQCWNQYQQEVILAAELSDSTNTGDNVPGRESGGVPE